MAQKYLLPCSCGRKVPVGLNQAGERTLCECGNQLEVPTLLGLTRLDRAEPETEPKSGMAWGARQQVMLVGLLITLVALVLALVLYATRPILVDIQSLPPRLAWQFWQEMHDGLDRDPSPPEEAFLRKTRTYRMWWVVVGAIGVVGVVTIVGSLLIPTAGAPTGPARPGSAPPSPRP